jgi:hypothetical protein
MKRPVAILAAVIAAIAFSCQTADAHGRHHKVDKRVTAVAVGAGVVSTVTYGSLIDWSWTKHSASYRWGAWGATTIGCMVLSPIVAAIVVKDRQLTSREVAVLEGSCIIPIVGGWLMNAAYDANPQWEPAPAKAHRHHRHHKKTSMKK